jgi:hypothetical protein
MHTGSRPTNRLESVDSGFHWSTGIKSHAPRGCGRARAHTPPVRRRPPPAGPSPPPTALPPSASSRSACRTSGRPQQQSVSGGTADPGDPNTLKRSCNCCSITPSVRHLSQAGLPQSNLVAMCGTGWQVARGRTLEPSASSCATASDLRSASSRSACTLSSASSRCRSACRVENQGLDAMLGCNRAPMQRCRDQEGKAQTTGSYMMMSQH